jgi:MFS family permease
LSSPSSSPAGAPWWRGLGRAPALALGLSWLGWAFDAFDGYLYSLVQPQVLAELLPSADAAARARVGGILFSVFVLGWAVGGIVFGVVADTWGRARTMVLTILLYSIATGLSARAASWPELAAWRALAAIGIGGEWATGAALVAEMLPRRARVAGAGVMQSAAAVGFLAATVAARLVGHDHWRRLFLWGLLPALAALLARLTLKEPERFEAERARRRAGDASGRPSLRRLFRPEHRRDTLVGAWLALICVFGFWGASVWVPSILREVLTEQGLAGAAVADRVTWGTVALNVGALVGYLAFVPAAVRWGRKPAFLVWLLGCGVSFPAIFLGARSPDALLWSLPVLGFFSNGVFSGFPIWLPELFPTALRATGAGFCYNAGRFLAASGPLLTGLLVGWAGSQRGAAAIIGCVYFLGLLALPFARETRDTELP